MDFRLDIPPDRKVISGGHRWTRVAIYPYPEARPWGQVSGPPIADSRHRKGNGGSFYQYCRQTGTWPKSVSGWDPHTQADKFVPFMPVRNVTDEYPPTLLIHGTADTDVPYEQSVMMTRELKKHEVPHRLVTIQNGEHGLASGSGTGSPRP